VWSEGKLPDDEVAWRQLIEALGMPDADARIAEPAVKDQLRRTTEEAVGRGVFGVPTTVVDTELFWGADSTDMLLDYITGDDVFASEQMKHASALPEGVARKRK
jgi:2-hydroxychromene-2-carboxylate isomerase